MSPKDQSDIFCMEAAKLGATRQPHRKKRISSASLVKELNIEGHPKTSESVCTRCGCRCADKQAKSPDYLCAKDFDSQIKNMELLQQTNWYFEGMTSQQAKLFLAKSDVGTFLVRDSSDPNFLFSVSVKTPRGPTSVRVLYSNGKFQLDHDSKLRTVVPKFETVVSLVDHYVRLGLDERNICRWLESSGRKDLPIVLKKPKVNNLFDLKHMCRLTINRSLPLAHKETDILKNVDKLGLPRPLKEYIQEYPHLN